MIYAHPDRLQGGFVWDWVDQSMYRTTADGRRYWGMGGEYGPNPGGELEFGDGLLQSDRTPNPQLFELRKVYAPVQFEGFDPASGRLTVVNRNDFVDLGIYDFSWEIAEDGVVVARGALPRLATAAHGRETLALPLPTIDRKPGAEYLLTVVARARPGAIQGVPDGQVVGWEQFPLAEAARAALPLPAGSVALDTRRGGARLGANGAELLVDHATGLVTYSAAGAELIQGGAPEFTRALTDNDVGTGVETTHAAWADASTTRKVEAVTARRLPDGRAAVTVRFMTGAGVARFEARYIMAGDGSVAVEGVFTPLKPDLPDPLRVGLAFSMPFAFDTLEWYGRGPHESYQDRKTGAPIALWRGRIADQNHDYMRPQETGNKVDVRWMELSRPGAPGLRVDGEAPLSMNALAFPYDDLSRRAPGTRRSSDIVPHDEVSLMIDAAQAGVGGDNQWDERGRPLPRYRIALQPLRYAFRLSPFAGVGTTPDKAQVASATSSPAIVQ